MPREKEGFRENLALLNKRFPDSDMVTARQAAEFIGCHIATVYRNIVFNEKTHRISKADLARQISN